MLRQFPFRILGFHSDNGSEFLNATVAKLLGTLLIEQTKSRPRQSNDNALVETKNGAVIRKHIGYSHIRAHHAERMQHFYTEHFNPYLNFLSPHLTSSVKRFGDYTLNMAKPPEPWLHDHTLPRKGPTRLPSQAVLPFVREA